MSYTRNSDFIRFEKQLPERVIRSDYDSIAVWSIARLGLFNRMEAQEKARSQQAPRGEERGAAGLARRIGWLLGSCGRFVKLALALARHGRADVVIRVSAFSIAGERRGRVLFTNRNLQDIYDALPAQNKRCLVIVNDLPEYRVRQPLAGAIVYRPAITPLLSRFLRAMHSRAVERIVGILSERIPLGHGELRKTIHRQLTEYAVWDAIYKLVRPERVYYESPHNAFEAEIVAAKRNGVHTIEIYHGTLSTREPSYDQRHLDYGALTHAVCHEYLSQSKDQTRLMSVIARYEKITTLGYRSNLSLSLRQKMKLRRVRNRPLHSRPKLLFVPSITDNDVQDVMSWVRTNRGDILRSFREVRLNLHPADTRERWHSLVKAHPFIRFSTVPLAEDIATASRLVVVSPTTVLQLRALKLDFIDLSRKVAA